MSTPKHTPGPWSIEDPMGPESLWIVEAGKQPHEWRCIAMVVQDDPTDDEDRDALRPISSAPEQEANARLIAAAPDLLEAAKEGRTDLIIAAANARDAARTDPRWGGVAEKLTERAAMMSAAIAKAEGRTP